MKLRTARFIVSVHDVTPETLGRVTEILALIENAGLAPATLLVVPGHDWTAEQLDRLRDFGVRGHQLAGHGWNHHTATFRNLRHRLHGLLISRDSAEHLAHETAGVIEVIRRCRSWFYENQLPAPTLYVPPAWAMGAVGRHDLQGLGFDYYEYLWGILDRRSGKRQCIPLLGFEADTGLRACFLRTFNAINSLLARLIGTVRLAIHPHDLELRLAEDLRRILRTQSPAPSPDSGEATHSPEERALRGCSAQPRALGK